MTLTEMRSRVCFGICFVVLLFSVVRATEETEAAPAEEFVLTLDHSNFEETIAKYDFIVVEFYAPWCGHCKKLAPEYEKAASILSKHDPPIVLAKFDANEEANRELASKYDVKGFPTLKIIRNGGKTIQEYKGPREADGIVEYLKTQTGPPSSEIKAAEDASNLASDKISVVGVFPEFSGKEYENFITVADKLRSDYTFHHTLNAKHLPLGESSLSEPTVRLFKPFDEKFVDSKDFNPEALEKFIEESSIPLVTIFNSDPDNHPHVIKFFNSASAKAMLFLNFSSGDADTFKVKYRDVAGLYKGKDIVFLMGDIEASQGAFQYFGLKEEQAPLIIVQHNEREKYFTPNLNPEKIAQWINDYKENKLKPYKKSEPIPEANNEPVKVVVGDNLEDIIFKSGKNVLLEFYAPWCGHCKKLAPILDEVATSFESEKDIIIAKLDATANDFPTDTFEVEGFPTLFFRSASGKMTVYEGDRSKDDLITFIEKNREKKTVEVDAAAPKEEAAAPKEEAAAVKEEAGKDEL